MRLYFMQHAEALPESVDAERHLSARGREDAMRMAAFLAVAGVRVSRVLHSGKARAYETAEIISAHLPAGIPMDVVADVAPNDSAEAFSGKIGALEPDTMLVGHMPFMARLVSRLAVAREQPWICNYEPGSVVCLERDESGGWAIGWMLRPALLHER